MNDGKNASARSTSGGRASTSPTALARLVDSALAPALGVQPIDSATSMIRCRVSAETPGRSFSANETAPFETPAARATSVIVGRGTRLSKPV